MHRPIRTLLGFGLLVALFSLVTGLQHDADGGLPASAALDPRAIGDAGVCLADIDLPLQVELEAPATASPGDQVDAVCRVVPGRTAERIELAARPSSQISLFSRAADAREAVGAGQEISFDVSASLQQGEERGTVDLLVTAWIDGRPYERGVTWNLAPGLPPTGTVVPREGRLPVRELSVGRASR